MQSLKPPLFNSQQGVHYVVSNVEYNPRHDCLHYHFYTYRILQQHIQHKILLHLVEVSEIAIKSKSSVTARFLFQTDCLVSYLRLCSNS